MLKKEWKEASKPPLLSHPVSNTIAFPIRENRCSPQFLYLLIYVQNMFARIHFSGQLQKQSSLIISSSSQQQQQEQREPRFGVGASPPYRQQQQPLNYYIYKSTSQIGRGASKKEAHDGRRAYQFSSSSFFIIQKSISQKKSGQKLICTVQ